MVGAQGVVQKETEIRQAAFGLIPQLPRDQTTALAVLDFATAILEIASTLDREGRRLAADLVMLLSDDRNEARRTLAFARKQLEDSLCPAAIARDLGEDRAVGERLRLVDR